MAASYPTYPLIRLSLQVQGGLHQLIRGFENLEIGLVHHVKPQARHGFRGQVHI